LSSFSIGYLITFLLTLIITSAFFSSAETGMMALNRYRLRHRVQQGHKTAKLVQKLVERPDRLLGVILIGNTFANIFAAALATVIAVRLWGDKGIAISSIALTFILLVFSEVMPKTLAAIHSARVAFFTAWPLSALLKILYPLVWTINMVVNTMLGMFRINVKSQVSEKLSQDELRTILRESSGVISKRYRKMLLHILDLEKIEVEDIMVPRNEIVGIDLQDEWEEVISYLRTTQHTRLLVYRDDMNEVIGLLHMRDVLNLLANEQLTKETLLKVTKEVAFVPEGTPISKQLVNFQTNKSRAAVVVDEYGDVQGLVTLEDILEEIVGEFTTDMAASSKDVHPQEDGSYLVDGTVTLRDLNRALGWQLPTTGPKTLSGLIIEHLEMIPPPGTCVRLVSHPLEVLSVQDNIIRTARIYGKSVKK